MLQLDIDAETGHLPLHIKGNFPHWLKGILVRNGPTPFTIEGKAPRHWFDGLGMLHAFEFDSGNVHYSNRFLRSEAYEAVFKKKTLNYLGFACDPCRTIFSKFYTHFFPIGPEPIHNADVNVAKIAENYVALTEIPLPVRFDPKTLETLGVLDYPDNLPKRDCFESAHPHQDTKSRELVNYLVDYGLNSTYTVYKIPQGSTERQTIACVPVSKPAYMHSFALTENFIILTEFPFLVNPLDFLIKNRPFIFNFKWQREVGTYFLVIERSSGDVVGRYRTDSFFAFHHVNAFEKDKNLILDIITYPDASIVEDLSHYTEGKSAHLLTDPEMAFKRFTLNLEEGSITSKTLTEAPMEFPRINNSFSAGRPYRFAYAVDPREFDGPMAFRPIYKIDVNTGCKHHWEKHGCYPGEPLFVPKPGATEEDDGVILSIVEDASQSTSFLLVLDAKNFHEIARAVVPHRIPPGLHSQFFGEGP